MSIDLKGNGFLNFTLLAVNKSGKKKRMGT